MVVYETINKINGKRYIGKDKHNDLNYLGSGRILQKAIKKYGKDKILNEVKKKEKNPSYRIDWENL